MVNEFRYLLLEINAFKNRQQVEENAEEEMEMDESD